MPDVKRTQNCVVVSGQTVVCGLPANPLAPVFPTKLQLCPSGVYVPGEGVLAV